MVDIMKVILLMEFQKVKVRIKIIKGKQKLSNGDEYIGQFYGGRYSGRGILTMRNGNCVYKGEFFNGLLNGKAVYDEKDSPKRYEGTFLNGKEHGFGISVSKNGDKYEGQFSNGKRHGNGVLIK